MTGFVTGPFGVTQIQLSSGDPAVISTIDVVTNVATEINIVPPEAGGAPGDTGGVITFTPPSGNVNVFADRRVGAQGSGGRNGYGVRICFGIFGCVTIGRSGSDGSPGGTGPTVNRVLNAGWGNISSVSNALPGITVSSAGGNGGNGGDSYGALPGNQGGAAGVGGVVILNSSVDVSTSGALSYGIFAQSRGGRGGNGGAGYIFSGGGSGGPASAGGAVTVLNSGNILTEGHGAIGIFAQSLGGAGGSGGDSFGLVGDAGSASVGGHGGTVYVSNSGNIRTLGSDAHGIMAQSIGGSGGNAGDAGGIVAFGGGPGAGGGEGRAVEVHNSGLSIETEGVGAFGIFAQSVGGGGGSGGYAAGLAAFGGSGSAGGNGGSVLVTNQAWSSIGTLGAGAHGIVAQSIGGGGGFGGSGGGLAAMGGSGSAAGSGGTVGVGNDGAISTAGAEARGIMAQSIGGGGGSASGTGGLVSLGGSGGSGGTGGVVTVTNTGAITTAGLGSDAIYAQSIGGGGGAGAASGGVVSIGGAGSAGGSGGAVTVTNSGIVTTTGDRARGILAQSIGGGGGSGGDSGGLVSVGGRGSVASNGATVTVTNTGSITTTGTFANAIQAQSIGGGGGDGGASGGAFSIGGSGAGGGNGGLVSVNNNRFLTTHGDDSNGIFAQSVGGGGGNGGNSGSVSGVAGLAIGGAGGGGGFGSAATIAFSDFEVTLAGNTTNVAPVIQTEGDRSNGVLVQSIGGGGGNGGFAVQATVSGAAASVSVAVGGSGGGGGQGGVVSVTGNATILTDGTGSRGLLAQSIGGGGGNGGLAASVSLGSSTSYSAAIAVGGSGGSGGNGGTVDVTTGGLISTRGAMSEGLIAQSIGGGGGNGGFAIAAGVGLQTAALGIGGSGGVGGNAANVTVTGTSTVETLGANSSGLVAQSIGGGGGNGGFAGAGSIGAASLAVGVGGSGGSGGRAGTVFVDNVGDISTSGANSIGLVAQSLGGGGGNGGFAIDAAIGVGSVGVGVGGSGGSGSRAGTVGVTSTGSFVTLGSNSSAIVAQSIGGGGGNGGFTAGGALAISAIIPAVSAAVNVGGNGGTGGTGGNVTVNSVGGSTGATVTGFTDTFTIATAGSNSSGILAQSIGGGGGNGGLSASFSGSFNVTGDGAASVAVSVGGQGGGGNHAGIVSVDSSNRIVTLGDNASGISAQSIGGGGGNGGFSLAVGVSSQFSGAFSVGCFGGGGGDAAAVSVTNTGRIVTAGIASSAIQAQSIGGGGGNGGASLSGSFSLQSGGLAASLGGFGGAGGRGGAVVVSSNVGRAAQIGSAVTIETLASSANGIEAQSIGGGGGNGGFSGSFTATVNATASMSLSIGGFGAAGNRASTVDVTGFDNITTHGDGANAILAQSIGGGGGNGGFSFAGTVSVPTGNSFSLAASLGGFGGSGGDAGVVTVDSAGSIVTSGAHANGVVAQSLGGGGGNGGLSIAGNFNFASSNNTPSVTASVGGFGGSGGAANSVAVMRAGTIRTVGDDSFGILAQSIGGGGGNGGMSITGSIGGADSKQFSASVGGTGGAGSGAGAVVVHNTGAITTGSITQQQQRIAALGAPAYQTADVVTGNGSSGIVAQSIGGGGGNGGFAFSGSIAPTGTATTVNVGMTVGGFGGSGGVAGNVEVVNVGALTTFGANANGIVAQSIGGGGGNGGSAVTGLIAGGNPQTGRAVNVAVSVGGTGGDGNVAGTVFVEQSGSIVTYGPASNGILAQSIGGGGGTGGNANTISLQLATSCTESFGLVSSCKEPKKTSVNVEVNVGGAGGAGNDAKSVTVINHDSITTYGNASAGIYAQSIGGGGGTGGQATVGLSGLFPGSEYVDNVLTVATLPFGRTSALTEAGKITLGGFGGAAGDGAVVLVTNGGAIRTEGRMSYGVFAQSVGGGGGGAGDGESGYSGGLSIGGFGGASGNGGTVTVTNSIGASIVTTGAGSSAIFAQSVGGGGGNGGAGDGILSIGGHGGASGNGSGVTVTNLAVLRTLETVSNGIFAQSVGGGGGNGGNAGSPYTLPLNGFSTSVGGNGSSGGNGGSVLLDNFGQIRTDGAASQAIFAQSIGGGGGNGATAIAANIQTGSTPVSAAVSIGGTGGGGGDGGSVVVNNKAGATILTNAINSTAIFAQSVGGGGGNGGYAVSASLAQAGSLAVAVGGNGGNGGSGGAVTVTNAGFIEINAKNSIGIMAQSVGGGGGTASSGLGVGLIPVAIGGSNGAVGNGGDVSVVNTGSIVIAGNNSVGIFAQSVGGGGGMIRPGGGATSVTLNAGGSGDGGTVTIVNSAGVIAVTGDNSIALYSQSVGGGGGAVGLAVDPPGQIGAFLFSGTAGGLGASLATTIDQTGNLVATGINSIALVAQSSATGGNGDIVVNILNATPGQRSVIMGGSEQGAGVFILNGANNALNNAGEITSVLGVDGYAVRGTNGNDRIANAGLVVGSVDLAGGLNGFDNQAGATFLSGTVVDLGAGNTLTNDGVLSPGDYQRLLTTSLSGNLLQTATGAFIVDLDLKAVTADRIDVAGSASVAGTVKVNLFSPLTAPSGGKPGTHDIPILTTTVGVAHPGLALEAPDTIVSRYSLEYLNANDIVLRNAIDYAPPGLNPNQRSLADAVNRIQGAQISPAFVPLGTALFFQPTTSSLASAYDSLSGSGTTGLQQSSFVAGDAFLTTMGRQVDSWLSGLGQGTQLGEQSVTSTTVSTASMGSLSLPGYSALGGQTGEVTRSGRVVDTDISRWRMWASAFAGRGELAGNASVGSVGSSVSGGGLSSGLELRIAPDALLGVSVGGSSYSFAAPLRETSGASDATHLSVYGAIRDQNAYLSSTLAYGYIDNTTKRHAAVSGTVLQQPGGPVVIPGFSEHLKGRFNSQSFSVKIEAGYRIPLGKIDLTPFAGVQLSALRSDGYDETTIGASQIGLSFAGRTTTSLPSVLGLKLSSEFALGADMRLSTWAQAAWKHEFHSERSTQASFLTAPGFNFEVQGPRPDADALRANLGAQLKLDANTSMFVGFDGEFSRDGQSYSGTAGIQFRW